MKIEITIKIKMIDTFSKKIVANQIKNFIDFAKLKNIGTQS